MPHPVPIIIGTTLAVIGSGYAFKKFIYDPHLAPWIDALIAQHREALRREREGYEPIPIPIQQVQQPPHPVSHSPHSPLLHSNANPNTSPRSQAPGQCAFPPTSSGRSSAVDCGQHRVARRRPAAEMYELDDARLIPDEMDAAYHAPPVPPKQRHPAPTYQPRRMHPVRSAFSTERQRPPPETPESPKTPVHHPTPRRVPPSPILISMDPAEQVLDERTPLAQKGEVPAELKPEIVETLVRNDEGGNSETSERLARQGSETTISDHILAPIPLSHVSSPSAPSGPISLVASPAPSATSDVSETSNFSHLTFLSRVSSTSHRTDTDDLEVISVSGTTTSYVDAETYTPRSPRSPHSPQTPLSRAMSPPVQIDAAALNFDGFSPLSTENLSLVTLSLPAPGPVALSAPSVSSWGEDEQWRSDSEWEGVSDAGTH